MARLPRYTLTGHPQHVVHRGCNRNPVFIAENDYQLFLECLRQALHRYPADVHAYVLMADHVHLLMTPHQENSISKIMQSVGGRYAKHMNQSYNRTGPLWNGRYRSTVVDSERYLFDCMRYIELNPVRTNVVNDPGTYRWSSYRRNALGEDDSVVTPHSAYQSLGQTDINRCQFYRVLFNMHISESVIRSIRTSTNSGWALGGDQFKTAIRAEVNRRISPLPRGGSNRVTHH